MDSGYYIQQDTGFVSGRDLASAVAQGLSREEYYAKERRREANDAQYQAVRVGYAEADVLRAELGLKNAQKEMREATAKLEERKRNYESKFGTYERSEDTSKYLRLIKARDMGVDAIEFERVVIDNPEERESLEELYGPAGA